MTPWCGRWTRCASCSAVSRRSSALPLVRTGDRAGALDRVIVVGTLVYLVTLFGGTWATFAYFAAIAPVLCLRVDDWLGLAEPMPLIERAPADASTGTSAE